MSFQNKTAFYNIVYKLYEKVHEFRFSNESTDSTRLLKTTNNEYREVKENHNGN